MPYNRQITSEVALTVTLDAYTANDVVGGLITFEVGSAGGGGTVRWVRLVDDHNQSEPYVLYLFNAAPTVIANDAAFAPAVADLNKLVGRVVIAATDYSTINSNGWAMVDELALDYTADGGALYGYLVATDTPDYNAATDLTIALHVWAD